jgi:pyrimidine-nucleoside phosphorylase
MDEARALAQAMVTLGREAGRETVALITDMNQPLGRAVGNGLEVAEAVEILSGMHGEGRLCRLSLELGAEMLVLGGVAEHREQGIAMMREAISNGEGLRRFTAMVAELGGDTAYLAQPERLYQTHYTTDAKSASGGWVAAMDVRAMGRAAQLLGAGRETSDSAIDPAVGYVMLKELGDPVVAGEPVARFYYNDEARGKEAIAVFTAAITVGDAQPVLPPLLYDVMRMS